MKLDANKEVCEKMTHLMMKYMDGELSDREIENLKAHVEECPSCKEDLEMYDFIRQELESEAGLMSPPEGFTASVMNRVAALPSPKKIAAASFDNKIRVLWGALSAFFGVAFLLVWYKEPILDFLGGVPAFSGYVDAITPAADWLNASVTSVFSRISSVAMTAFGFVADYRYVFFVAFCVLCGSLFFVSRRRAAGKSRHRA